MFRDGIKTNVEFRIRPTRDLRAPRDAYRYARAIERRRVIPIRLAPLEEGPLEPEIIPATEAPRDLYEDDHLSELRDDWRAERREWERDRYGSGPF